MTGANDDAFAHYGSYVDDSYAQRNEGYDWVGVEVKPFNEQRVQVSVRSRGDKKRPTCTLHVLAMIQDDNTLQVYEGQTGIRFTFSGDQLTISAVEGQSDDQLAYYCSGGANLAGTYSKINGSLDASQVDPLIFSKTLMMGDNQFFVEAEEGRLTVTPVGLEQNDPFTMEIDGTPYEAEIGDITGDNQPEVAVYLVDDQGKGSAQVFTVLGGRSMIQVNLPDISNNAEASEGYQGNDEWAMVENSLVRRFPIAGGGTKQIQYKVVAGEAMPQLQVENISVY